MKIRQMIKELHSADRLNNEIANGATEVIDQR